MYRLTQGSYIQRLSDGAMIPADPTNRDYADYLAWVAAGGVAEPYTPTAAESNAPILAQLDALDAKSVRAARAVAVALANGTTPDATDLAKLVAIEAQAATLRDQLVS